MNNDAYTAALIEAYVVCPANNPTLQTLEIRHASITTPIYLVSNNESITAPLEDHTIVTFEACAISIKRPPKNDDGIQNLDIQVCNADRRISDFFEQTKNYLTKVSCIYRPYLANILSEGPQATPLELIIVDATVSGGIISAKASFADLVNKAFPKDRYTRRNYPNLAGF